MYKTNQDSKLVSTKLCMSDLLFTHLPFLKIDLSSPSSTK